MGEDVTEFEKHEAMCKQCGRCCRFKWRWNGEKVIVSDAACGFLDAETNKCLVYFYRFSVQPSCLPLSKAITSGALPPDCPYVKDMPNYISEWPEEEPVYNCSQGKGCDESCQGYTAISATEFGCMAMGKKGMITKPTTGE